MYLRGPARLLPVVLLLLPARAAGETPAPIAIAMAWCHTMRAWGAAFASLPVRAPCALYAHRKAHMPRARGSAPSVCGTAALRTAALPHTLGTFPQKSWDWMRPTACAGLRSKAGDGDGAALEDPRAHNKPIRVSSWTEGDKGQADDLKSVSTAICI
jgi:hypothetical protein